MKDKKEKKNYGKCELGMSFSTDLLLIALMLPLKELYY